MSAIEYVTSDDLPVMYTLEGHGEAELSDGITSEIEKQNVELKSLNLVTEGEVPEDAEAILICSPTSDFSEEEANQIISYLEKGGKALIFTDYVDKDLTNVKKFWQTMESELSTALSWKGIPAIMLIRCLIIWYRIWETAISFQN